MVRFIFAAACALSLSASAQAQNDVQNHLNSWAFGPSYEGLGYLNLRDDEGNDDARAISGFRGDGNRLHSYEGYYIGYDDPTPNWSLVDFSISFWFEQSHMLNDPLMTAPTALDRLAVVTEPSNPNWSTPAFQVGQFGVYHLVFDLDALNIETSIGASHFICVSPMVNDVAATGRFFQLGATGGPNDLGDTTAWFWSEDQPGMPWPTTALQPYFPYLADRITTVVPAPGVSAVFFAALSILSRRRRTS
jgi:uncharacterized protein (TIGR03382 family)